MFKTIKTFKTFGFIGLVVLGGLCLATGGTLAGLMCSVAATVLMLSR